MIDRPHMFLDIDGVLATDQQFYSNPAKWDEELHIYKYDSKCVKVFNYICAMVNPVIILSSDWKTHYTIEQINAFFGRNGITHKISDITPNHWGKFYTKLEQLEECRASEIKEYVEENGLTNYVAVDDLNLKPYLPEGTFVQTPRSLEGIKQSGIKDKIIKILEK